jgi:hypothetical protein
MEVSIVPNQRFILPLCQSLGLFIISDRHTAAAADGGGGVEFGGGGSGNLVVLFNESGRCHFCRTLCSDRASLKTHLQAGLPDKGRIQTFTIYIFFYDVIIFCGYQNCEAAFPDIWQPLPTQGDSPASATRALRQLRELFSHLCHTKTQGKVPGEVPVRETVKSDQLMMLSAL